MFQNAEHIARVFSAAAEMLFFFKLFIYIIVWCRRIPASRAGLDKALVDEKLD